MPICLSQSISLEKFQNKTGFLDLRHVKLEVRSELAPSYPMLIATHDIV